MSSVTAKIAIGVGRASMESRFLALFAATLASLSSPAALSETREVSSTAETSAPAIEFHASENGVSGHYSGSIRDVLEALRKVVPFDYGENTQQLSKISEGVLRQASLRDALYQILSGLDYALYKDPLSGTVQARLFSTGDSKRLSDPIGADLSNVEVPPPTHVGDPTPRVQRDRTELDWQQEAFPEGFEVAHQNVGPDPAYWHLFYPNRGPLAAASPARGLHPSVDSTGVAVAVTTDESKFWAGVVAADEALFPPQHLTECFYPVDSAASMPATVKNKPRPAPKPCRR
jgi:hypothetical protein